MAETFTITNAEQRRRLVDYLLQLDLSKPLSVTVEEYEKKRTLGQNALLHRWQDEIVKHVHEYTGQTKAEIHRLLMGLFLSPVKYERQDDGSMEPIYSTQNLTAQEFRAYLEKVHAWALTDLGLSLPTQDDLR